MRKLILLIFSSVFGVSCAESNFRGAESGPRPNEPPFESPELQPQPIPPRPLLPSQPPPTCEDRDLIIGAHLIFLVDNSGSMLSTDCPGRTEQQCQQTNREKAILATFDWLADAAEQNQDSTQALSYLSVARFTPRDKGQRLEQINDTDFVSLAARKENRVSLEEQLKFNRQPYGDTPLLNALLLGEQIQADASNRGIDKKTVFVLLTDGEATDRSPSEVRAQAEALQADLYTIRINHLNIDHEQRFAAHKQNMQENYPDWALDEFSDLDAYVEALMALPTQISSAETIEISSSQALQTAIFDDIIRKRLRCP